MSKPRAGKWRPPGIPLEHLWLPPRPSPMSVALASVIGHSPRVSIMPAKFYILEKASYLFLRIKHEPNHS